MRINRQYISWTWWWSSYFCKLPEICLFPCMKRMVLDFSPHSGVSNEFPGSELKWLLWNRIPTKKTQWNSLVREWLISYKGENNRQKGNFDARSWPINFNLAHMGIPPVEMIRQHSNLQHKSVHKSFPAKEKPGKQNYNLTVHWFRQTKYYGSTIQYYSIIYWNFPERLNDYYYCNI